VPFDFLRKKGKDQPKPGKSAPKEGASGDASSSAGTASGTRVAFDGLTEEWRLVGNMLLSTRLSDALNQREALAIADVRWAPIDGSGEFSPAPGLKSVDPYDLIVVLAPEAAKSAISDVEKSAALGQKRPVDVTLEAPPLRITGRVYLPSGMAPERLMDRSAEMFVPVVGGVAYIGDRAVSEEGVDAILVNRFYLRGVRLGADGPTITRAQPAPQSASASIPQPHPPKFGGAPETAQTPQTAAPKPAANPAHEPAPRAAQPAASVPPPASAPTPRAVPDWPAADRKPDAAAKPRDAAEWPAADRRPESPRPEPARSEPPPAEPARPESPRPESPRPEPPRPESPRPEPARPEPTNEAGSTPDDGPAPRRDIGARGWPTPESGCRPKRGGLPPRD
jgi:hypothetical protein